jgi:hypothetical protein
MIMCDYSIKAASTRDAAKDDKLVVHDFGCGTKGFVSRTGDQDVAVCVRPGTEIAFDEPIKVVETGFFMVGFKVVEYPATAVFAQVNKDVERMHHDCLQFADGRQVMLTKLTGGQTARVLQLPAAPKTEDEVEEQRRVAYAG